MFDPNVSNLLLYDNGWMVWAVWARMIWDGFCGLARLGMLRELQVDQMTRSSQRMCGST